ncbi:GDSL-type esterase/lipase family protein [Micromonospora costi]|uniref:SGNH/GDSL hydrolase family protein n=1 Tax=Micromonospora costi TaxID=1530042 RepID=A0A3A9ZV04_9ACTN|nr:GDSL-type esterase/lipase family protein [Micromonospora costi]RKN52132.1 SGNH/GDSL hydrolase family protein [Micromonospora costi]
MSRPRVLAALVTLAVLVPSAPATAATGGRPAPPGPGGWSAAWTAAHHHPVPGNEWDGPNWSTDGFADASVRQVVRVSAGGALVRVRLSNRYGTRPLRLAGATIGRSGGGAAVRPGTLRPLTFDRRLSTSIPPGAEATSDPVALPVRALDALTVTLYDAHGSGPATFHQTGLTTTYRASGDHRFDRGAAAFAGETSQAWYYLAGVDVAGSRTRGTVVAFGDSHTDGYGSTPGADNRYPDELAEQLLAAGRPLAVANAGISGNKLLADSPCYGERGTRRFGGDVLEQPGVRAAVVLIGLNDIGAGGYPDFGCGASPVVTTGQLVAGHRALIRAARARGVTVIGATLPPIKNATGYDSPEKEAVRDALNHWIRTSGEYDAVADLDRILADPADPDALNPAYDHGDHLHLNDAGAARAAAAVAALVR